MTRVHNTSKELKFSLVKSFISKQTFRLLYSSLHQCNAELQNKTDINTNQIESTDMGLQSCGFTSFSCTASAGDGEGQS